MVPPEFSRPIALDRIGLKEKSFELTATEAECAALAKRLAIPAVRSLTATVGVKLVGGGKIVRLKGRLQAELVQICVVTLEPMGSTIDEEFSRQFGAEPTKELSEVVIDLDEEDPPDPVFNGQIDMGEAAAEHLALAMDPFPRAPGASFIAPPDSAPETPAPPNPFEVLADRRKKV